MGGTNREVLAAILFAATTGCTSRQLSPVFGPSGPTAHRRFTEWSRAGVWGKLHRDYDYVRQWLHAFASIAATLICYRRLGG